MADDIFTVLGRIEVDLKALVASLAQAEQQVTASTNRQAKSYEDFALRAKKAAHDAAMASATHRASANEPYTEGAYAAKFGGGGAGAAAEHAGKAAGKAAEAFEKVGHHSRLAMGGIRGFSHIINTLLPGLGGTAAGLLSITRHLGYVGAAALIAAGAFAILIARYTENARVAYELKRSMDTLDFERVSGELNKVNESIAQTVDLFERGQKSGADLETTMGRLTSNAQLFWKSLTGEGPEKIVEKQKTIAEAHEKASVSFGKVAKETISLEKEFLTIQERKISRTAGEADTVLSLTTAYESLKKTQQDLYNNTLKELELDAARLKAKMGRKEITEGEYQAEIKLLDLRKRTAQENLRDQGDQADQAQIRRKNELAVAATASANKIAEAQGRMADSALATAKAIVASESEIVQATAHARGEVVSSASAIDQAYKLEVKGIAAADERSREKYERERNDIKNKIADADKLQRTAEEQADKSVQAALKAATQEGASATDKAAFTEAERIFAEVLSRRRANTADKQQLTELEAARESEAAVTRDKLTIASGKLEKDQLLEAERVRKEVIAKNISDTEAYYGLRKAMGMETLQGEIAAQKEINQAYKEGTREWYEGLTKVASLQRQMRDEARSSAQNIIGQAAESLKKRTGRKKFDMGELQAEAGRLREGDQGIFASAATGGKVDTDALLKGLGRQAGFEKFQAQGGNLSSLFNQAITNPLTAGTTTFSAGADRFAEAVDKFAAASGGGGDRSGPPSIREAEAALASAFRKQTGWLDDPSSNKVSEKVGRQTYLESKRGVFSPPSVEIAE